MTDTAEIIARAIYRKDWSISVLDDGADDPQDPMRWDSVTKDEHDKYIWWAKAVIAALKEVGIMLLTKKQAIDYVMDLPIDELGETHTWPVNPNTAGRRLRELQKAMIGAGK